MKTFGATMVVRIGMDKGKQNILVDIWLFHPVHWLPSMFVVSAYSCSPVIQLTGVTPALIHERVVTVFATSVIAILTGQRCNEAGSNRSCLVRVRRDLSDTLCCVVIVHHAT